MSKAINNTAKYNIAIDKKVNRIMQVRYNNLSILNPSPRIPKESYSKSSGIVCNYRKILPNQS